VSSPVADTSGVDAIAELRRLEREIARLRNVLRTETRVADELPTEAFRILRVEVCKQTYGVALDRVVEIVRIARLTKQGQEQRTLLGVLNYRGTAVPVIDLGRRLVGEPTRLRLSTPMAIVRAAGRTIGLVVDHIPGMIDVPAAAERHTTSPDGADTSIVAILEVGGDLIQVVDADSLYDAEIRSTLGPSSDELSIEGDPDVDARP